MSEKDLQEYIDYYAARAERYANNDNYKHSYQIESKILKAIQSSNSMEEFKIKLGNLNELCAIALVKDEAIIEKDFFEKHKEEIRKLAPMRILERLNEINNPIDLGIMITEETNKNSLEISSDEAHRQLIYDWHLIDDITIYENAEVPEKYKSGMREIVNSVKELLVSSIDDIEKTMQAWEDNWRVKPEITLEYRHKRLYPFKEEHIKEQIEKYKQIIKR